MSIGILYYGWIHPRNEDGLKLIAESGVPVIKIGGVHDIEKYQGKWIVLSLDTACPNIYKNKLVISGPHFFPININQKIIFNSLSDWIFNWVKELPNVTPIKIFFPIRSELYLTNNRDNVILYTKHRSPSSIQNVKEICQQKCQGIIRHFDYNTKYEFNIWMNILKTTKYCIWLGSSESQGFAMHEVLLQNIPIILLDCDYWTDNYPPDPTALLIESIINKKIDATSATVWSANCGIKTTVEKLGDEIVKMEDTYMNYSPRKLIMDTLSPERIYQEYIDHYNKYANY